MPLTASVCRHVARRAPLLAGVALLSLDAAAQTATTPVPTPKPTTDNGIEQITVTSERRSQSAQSVGASISVISGKTLAARNVNNVFDLQYLTPSLQVTPQFGSGQPSFAIRGMGFNDYASNNAPTVGIYVDEVAYPVPFGTNGAMFDIARVEVLRGPQGTLYGRNTTAGAINYILNKPTSYWTGNLSAQYARFNSTKIDGFLSGPLGDKAQIRIAGQTQQGGAWQHSRDNSDRLGDVDRSGLRVMLDVEPTDTLKIELEGHGSHDRSDAVGLHLYAPLTSLVTYLGAGQPIFPADTDRQITGWGTSPQFAKLIGIRPDAKPFSHIDTGGVSLRADQSLAFATLTDLVSYDYMQRQEYDNFDASSLAIADVFFNSRANVFANELRLTSHDSGRLKWVGGIYYANQYLADIYDSGFQSVYKFDRTVQYSQKVNTISGFGQATYALTHRLSLTGGLRVEHEVRDLNNFRAAYADSATQTAVTTLGHRSTDFTEPTGKIELQYTPFTHDMLYASVSRGVKSGGFTTYNSVSAQVSTAPFAPEKVWAYEIGNKADFPRQHLRLNVSAFYYDYHDEQIQSAVVNPLTGLVGAIINAPRSHLYGGEMQADWSPIPHLLLTQSAGWATGQFDRFNSVVSAVREGGVFVGVYRDRKGDSLPSPKITLNGSASYTFDLGRYDLTTGIDYSLRSTYRSLFGKLYDVAGYTLFNANIALSPKNHRWMLAAFGQNILDKHYDVTRNYFVSGDNIAQSGLPAVWGVRASVGF
ncbi:outer membrane receptor protein involved in Fe transport [Endobacter medicaginis]|uniref:Outer membrane receptor protein involved in Fe transport n=1 Tax=Endobacter medicaginis TaxID=1181271 RepID=A0A850NNL2_9PROT|nr:TonB-dependent receptor [Endobacter medicaginis]MBB3174078.1 outer membrane receptor protein involved in Fe transport [Endobacter medicaginis]MCX5476076.1 TonB-dependent receptor [Endobacter medicaginis]NVN31351.1 TonB-dependent receptor [Endobacter medicaginis]